MRRSAPCAELGFGSYKYDMFIADVAIPIHGSIRFFFLISKRSLNNKAGLLSSAKIQKTKMISRTQAPRHGQRLSNHGAAVTIRTRSAKD